MSVERLELVERFLRIFSKVVRVSKHEAHFVSRWWQQATTENQLQWLLNRALADIGVSRRDIRQVARACTCATSGPQEGPAVPRCRNKRGKSFRLLRCLIDGINAPTGTSLYALMKDLFRPIPVVKVQASGACNNRFICTVVPSWLSNGASAFSGLRLHRKPEWRA